VGDQYADLSVPTSQDVHREFTRELYVAFTPISETESTTIIHMVIVVYLLEPPTME
jgi:hypothetical protein